MENYPMFLLWKISAGDISPRVLKMFWRVEMLWKAQTTKEKIKNKW